MKLLRIALRPQGFTRIRGDLGGWAKQLIPKLINIFQIRSFSVFQHFTL